MRGTRFIDATGEPDYEIQTAFLPGLILAVTYRRRAQSIGKLFLA